MKLTAQYTTATAKCINLQLKSWWVCQKALQCIVAFELQSTETLAAGNYMLKHLDAFPTIRNMRASYADGLSSSRCFAMRLEPKWLRKKAYERGAVGFSAHIFFGHRMFPILIYEALL